MWDTTTWYVGDNRWFWLGGHVQKEHFLLHKAIGRIKQLKDQELCMY